MHFNIKHKMFLQIVYLYLNGISNQGNFQIQENSDLISYLCLRWASSPPWECP